MKTANFFRITTLAIVFSVTAISFSNAMSSRNVTGTALSGITYQVTIHLPGIAKDPCSVYLVQVLDEHGQQVAPLQVFVKGVSKYIFHEKAPVLGRERIAVLVPATYPGDHYVCTNDFNTQPDALPGPFNTGQTYNFNLYPSLQDPAAGTIGSGGIR